MATLGVAENLRRLGYSGNIGLLTDDIKDMAIDVD